MGWSVDLGIVKAEDVEDVVKTKTADLRAQWAKDVAPPEEAANVARVAAMAKAGVESFGGKAHVWMGGHFRVEADGSSQTSVSITVSVNKPRPAPAA